MLAPQLRQSLEMLQAPILELRTLIQSELQQNPTLEEIPPDTTPLDMEPHGGEVDCAKELSFEKEFEILSRIDDEWRDYFLQQREPEPADSSREKRSRFFDSYSPSESLQDHLMRQLRLSDLDDEDAKIGELIIGNVNNDGYLAQSIEELAASAGVDPGRATDILFLIQEFDPVGVAARDLKECLLIQIERLGQGDSLAARIIRDHIDLLGTGNHQEIARALNASVDEVRRAAGMIGTLEPKPGRPFGADTPSYILPEVIVEKVAGKYIALLNDDQIPRLRISRNYRHLMEDDRTSTETRNYIRNKIRAGLFIMKSIEQRKRTMRKVAEEIISVQRDFFDSGVSGLKPLTMAEVARKTGVHETTVCRCIANKHMMTPRGMFEMKYFFAPGLKTTTGQDLSNKAVQDMILSMVSVEDPSKPLSDQEMSDRLREKGISIARRTVAKYRVALNIPPSHLRK